MPSTAYVPPTEPRDRIVVSIPKPKLPNPKLRSKMQARRVRNAESKVEKLNTRIAKHKA